MAGETDLARLLDSLEVSRRPGRYTFVTGDWPELAAVASAMIDEVEGPTYVVTVEQAVAAGAPVGFVAGWLTLSVHSALEAVGLTAWFSDRLASAGIACNVLAGFHHDHLLVPIERTEEAAGVLTGRVSSS